MTTNEGKALLRECLEESGVSDKMEEIITYKNGNRKEALSYQTDAITTRIESRDIPATVKFVVKCFYHMGIYIAWRVESFRKDGKYICYKKNLHEAEQANTPYFAEVKTENNGVAYYFKGKDGIMQFVRKCLDKE